MRQYRKYTKDLLEPLVRDSFSVAQVLRKLGIPQAGGSHAHIKRVILRFGLSTEHFTGSGSNSGPGHRGGLERVPAVAILVVDRNNGRREHAHNLRRSLLELGVSEVCAFCGLGPVWEGKPITLHLDHISGDFLDNRRDNLRFLCPNCHSQTPTHNRRKTGRRPAIIMHCAACGVPFDTKHPEPRRGCFGRYCSVSCSTVANKLPVRPEKVVWPEVAQLSMLVWEVPVTDIAKNLGVSGNAVGKRCRKLGIEVPSRGYWAKLRSGK